MTKPLLPAAWAALGAMLLACGVSGPAFSQPQQAQPQQAQPAQLQAPQPGRSSPGQAVREFLGLGAYLLDTDPKPSGYGGTLSGLGTGTRFLRAIDVKTGKLRWQHEYPNLGNAPSTTGAGLLSTAGNVVFTGDDQGNLMAFSADQGRILWHFRAAAPQSNGPITYLQDRRQWVVLGAGDTLYAYTLAPAALPSSGEAAP